MKTAYRSRLPHIVPVGATFFVTFRLADSLPLPIVRELKIKMDTAIKRLQKEKPKGYKETIRRQRKLFFKCYDHQLDEQAFGACYLKQPAIAKIVEDKLHQFDGDKYALQAYCIMPNHVHLLIDTSIQIIDENDLFLNEVPADYTQLHQIMRLIKGGTAYTANKQLNREHKFWQKDSYDHYVRDEREFWNIVQYILDNPVKAGLVEQWQDYPYTFVAPRLLEL
ncbi:MAG: transposase [Bacteroidota bacterium]